MVSRDVFHLLKDLPDTLLQGFPHSVACGLIVFAFDPLTGPDESRPENRVVLLINKLDPQPDFPVQPALCSELIEPENPPPDKVVCRWSIRMAIDATEESAGPKGFGQFAGHDIWW